MNQIAEHAMCIWIIRLPMIMTAGDARELSHLVVLPLYVKRVHLASFFVLFFRCGNSDVFWNIYLDSDISGPMQKKKVVMWNLILNLNSDTIFSIQIHVSCHS